MNFVAIALLMTLAPPAAASAQSVIEHYGNISYERGDGSSRQLTQAGGFGEPVLSPDGLTAAFIHIDTKTDDGVTTSLWVADVSTGRARELLRPRLDSDPKRDMSSFQHPRFSVDGGFIYVDADAWATSSAIHQVDVRSGKERFVIDGSDLGVLRNGPMRGYLLVSRHMYHPAPALGSYDPVYIVRPDAKERVLVPGSDKDDGARSVPSWLKSNGWRVR